MDVVWLAVGSFFCCGGCVNTVLFDVDLGNVGYRSQTILKHIENIMFVLEVLVSASHCLGFFVQCSCDLQHAVAFSFEPLVT